MTRRASSTEPLRDVLRRMGLGPGALAGEVAVVTGGGRGLGREIALALALLGAKVAVADVSDAGGVAETVARQTGIRTLFVRADVSREADVERLAAKVRESLGAPTVLVNNAIVGSVAAVLEMTADLWDRVLAVNLRGPFLTCRAFLPDMLAAGRGTIVNLTSADAMPYASAYVASKEGLAAFSRSLALEVGQGGVRVIAFGPGLVDTPGLREALAGMAARAPFDVGEAVKGALRPQVAAAAAAFLVARLADQYHGEVVDAYTVLERAARAPTPEPAPDAEPGEGVGRAPTLAAGLRDILGETVAEFGRLPVFVRPMAQHGFRRLTGWSVPDWLEAVDRLVRGLGADSPALDPGLEDHLRRLSAYYRQAPAQVARFTRDEDALRDVRRLAERRSALIDELVAALKTPQRASPTVP